jgi:hypothetical protein
MKSTPSPRSEEKLRKGVTQLIPFDIPSVHGKLLPRLKMDTRPDFDRLPGQYCAALLDALNATDVYVVYTYRTPIAWYPMNGTGEWIMPAVSYSPTSDQHAMRVRHVIETADERLHFIITDLAPVE